MNIVYLVFGNNIEHYQQVFFSIYTALHYKEREDKIIIITENPLFFNHFKDNIICIPINRNTINQWEGEHKFFWRVKIKALELIAKSYPNEHILYLDGDTFFYNSTSLLKDKLNQGHNFMHIMEGKLSELPTKTEKLMWKQMKNKTYAGIFIDNNTCMWNAGTIGISTKHFDSISLTLKLNDELCADNVTRKLIEQLSFSIGTNHYSKLIPADDIIGHYWGNKNQWNDIISNWLKTSFMYNLNMSQMKEELLRIPFSEIPIYTKQSNTHERLTKKLNNLFKSKKKIYLTKKS